MFGNDAALDTLVPQALADHLCGAGCVVTREFSPLEPDVVEFKYYAPGIGVFLETGGSYAVRSPRERIVNEARRAMLARGLHEALCTTLVSERLSRSQDSWTASSAALGEPRIRKATARK